MKEELVEFFKYYSASLLNKVVSFYIVPHLILGLTYYDQTYFYYLQCAFTFYFAFNFANQAFFSPKYKGKVLILHFIVCRLCCL